MKEKFLCKFSKLPYVDLVAGVRCGHPHVLAGVVAADGGRVGEPGAGDGQGVSLLGRIFYRDSQEGIYYKWASVKMTLKFHFLWSTLF